MALTFAACGARTHYPAGGYPYPEHFTDKDTNFYFYPVRDKFSRQDSFRDATAYMSYRDLCEPNLSLKPMPNDIFRLSYQAALRDGPIIIILTRDSIVVKHGHHTEEWESLPDTSRLDPLDRQLVRILDDNYPLDDKQRRRSVWRQHYLDSMGHLHPQLYDPAYYRSLIDKEYPHSNLLFSYQRRSEKITSKDFDHLVQVINASGYWNLPIQIPCKSPPFDGWGYTLEANTAKQYNMVSSGSCDVTGPFDRACQELINYAGLGKEIHLANDSKADTAKIVVEPVQLEDIKEPPKRKPAKHR